MWNVFENCWLLLTLAGIAFVVASVVRQEKPEWGYKPLIVPLLLAGLAFGLDYAFTTDYESVKKILPACKQAAASQDANAIIKFISPNYKDRFHRDYNAISSRIKHTLPKASINRVRTQSHVITMDGDNAESQFTVGVHLNKDSGYPGAGSMMMVKMKFEYEKIAESWYIRRMDLEEVNYQSMNWGDVP